MYRLLPYTRKPTKDKTYEEKLAYSMHLAISINENDFTALAHNFGILFAKATFNENHTLKAKSLLNPYVFKDKDSGFGIIAKRTEADGSDDSESAGKLLVFKTEDFLYYEEVGLLDLKTNLKIDDAICNYNPQKNLYEIIWKDDSGKVYQSNTSDIYKLKADSEPVSLNCGLAYETIDNKNASVSSIEGIMPRNIIEIPDDIGKRLLNRLTTPKNIKTEVSEMVEVKGISDIEKIKAKLTYTDGTSVYKKVKWNTENIDFNNKNSEIEISGEVYQKNFIFPLAENRADPMIIRWQGKYYYIATNDADGNNSVSIRAHENFEDIMDAPESEILNNKMYGHMKKFFWAPEFHVIKGKLYILMACSPKDFGEIRCHVIKLKDNADPAKKESWEEPIPVIKKDGEYLCNIGLTLDMTCFDVEGSTYAVWAQRELSPVDLGSWLYIAKMDLDEPHKLITDPVLISVPEYGWANNHTFVDEGPFPLFRGDTLYLTFSSALVDYTYCVGVMTADINSDLLNPNSWKKCNYPLMTQLSSKGESGTGHNAYVEDEDGNVWNTYHARPGLKGPRSTGIRRVHFTSDGFPLFDVDYESDINPDLKMVKTTILIK